MRTVIRTEEARPTWDGFPVSQAVTTDEYVFTAVMAFDDVLGRRQEAAVSITDETRIILQTMDRILQEAGSSINDVVMTTCYIDDKAYHREMSAAYANFWQGGQYPVRCTFVVGVAGDCRVAIQAIAARRETDPDS